ncbi:MAG: hypothetical protein ACHQVS_01905 [Candidatus Babeliales bacterium]
MMNSVYKKIALVCVMSLAANQAAHAFQFPNVWNWIKGNQKTSTAIVAGIAAFAAALLMLQYKQKNAQLRYLSITPRETLSDGLSKRLAALTKTSAGDIATSIKNSSTYNIEIVKNKGESNDNPLACVMYDTKDGHLVIEHIAVDKSLWITSPLKKLALALPISTHEDIHVSHNVSDADIRLIKNQIMAADKGIEPVYEGRVFRRGRAREALGIQINRVPGASKHEWTDASGKDKPDIEMLEEMAARSRDKLTHRERYGTKADHDLTRKFEEAQKSKASKDKPVSAVQTADSQRPSWTYDHMDIL